MDDRPTELRESPIVLTQYKTCVGYWFIGLTRS